MNILANEGMNIGQIIVAVGALAIVGYIIFLIGQMLYKIIIKHKL
jgi:hypothetical protein